MRRHPWFRLVSYAVILLSCAFFVSVLSKNLSSIPLVLVNASTISFFMLTLMLYVAIGGMNGTVWHILLQATGETARYRDSIMIYSLSNFAKYIPGNIANQAGRIALAKTHGMQVSRVVVTMLVETGWAISASACLGTVLLVSAIDRIGIAVPKNLSYFNLACIAVLAGSAPLLLGYCARRFVGVSIQLPGIASLVLCYIINLVSFALMGWIMNLIAVHFFHLRGSNLILMAAVFSIAWIAGLITPGAPAGLGVREAITVAMLGPVYGTGNAIGITIAARLVTVAGDCLIFVAGMFMRHRWPPVIIVQQP